MNTRPTILLDIDGVLLNFTRVYLDLVEATTGRTHREEEIHSFDYRESIVSKDEDEAIWRRIAGTPGLVMGLPEYEGAMAFLAALRLRGRVVACTSPASALWTAERAQWLLDVAGFNKRDIVICSDKALVRGDYLIDDHYTNIQEWEAADLSSGSGSLGILFTRPWNWKFNHHTRAWNYPEVLKFIDECEAC